MKQGKTVSGISGGCATQAAEFEVLTRSLGALELGVCKRKSDSKRLSQTDAFLNSMYAALQTPHNVAKAALCSRKKTQNMCAVCCAQQYFVLFGW